jgi:hypothetical protein
VENLDGKAMPFAIGGHPGINVPFAPGTDFEDYYLCFGEACSPSRIGFTDEIFLSGEDRPYPLEDGRTTLIDIYNGTTGSGSSSGNSTSKPLDNDDKTDKKDKDDKDNKKDKVNEEETTEEVSEEIIEDYIDDETEEETLENENNYPEETTTEESDESEEAEDDETDTEDTTLVTIGDDQ